MAELLHRFRLLLILPVLAVLAAPRVPESVDDVYIVADYARQWLATGRLEWTNGERVEGYSGIASVALAAAGQLAGVAPELALKFVAAVSMVGVAALGDRTFAKSWWGTAALAGLLLASPSVRWAVDGMDAPLFAFVLAGGWLAFLRGRFLGAICVLAFASLVRADGLAHLGVGLLLVAIQRPPRAVVGGSGFALLLLATYHGVRIAWFGEVVPTPTLLKIVAVPASLYGVRQAIQDVIPYLGVLALLAGARWPAACAALVPLFLQMSVEIRASGDWMTGGRLVMPGAIASAIMLGSLAHRPPGWLRGGFGACSAIAGIALLPVGWGAIAFEVQPLPTWSALRAGTNRGLVTPLPEDVAWIVEHVPAGECVLTNDVGMVGGIPGVCVLDMRGLATRASAEADVAGRQEQWFRELLASDRRPFAVRQAWWGVAPRVPADWLDGAYAQRQDVLYPAGSVGWFVETIARLPADERARRWLALRDQHPDHPWIAWRAAIAAADNDDLAAAHAIARRAAGRWPEVDMAADDVRRWSFVDADVPLNWRAGAGFEFSGTSTFTTRSMACPEEVLHLSASKPLTLRVGDQDARALTAGSHELPLGVCGATTIRLSDGEGTLFLAPS